MANEELDTKDAKISAEQAETNSEDDSGEYEEAFEDIRKCPVCECEGPLYQLCAYCEHPELRYSILVSTDDFGMNKMDK